MKIGLTGATGFLGMALTERLKQEGHALRLFSRRPKPPGEEVGEKGESAGQIEVFHGELSRENDLAAFCRDVDVVFHLAGAVILNRKGREEMEQTNVRLTGALAEACKGNGVRKMVHCSSISAILPPEMGQKWDEKRPLALQDRADYNRTKAEAEKLLLEVSGKGLDVVIVNPTGVIGPEDWRPSLAGQNILDLIRGKSPATAGGGFDFVDVRDVADGMVRAMEKGRAGERYILGGHYMSLRDLAREIASLAGSKPPRIHLPIPVLRALLPIVGGMSRISGKPALVTREMIDATIGGERIVWDKARKELGYEARPLRETLEDTVNWFKAHFPQ